MKKIPFKSLLLIGLISVGGIATGCSRQTEIEIQTANFTPLAELEAKYSAAKPLTISFWTGFGALINDSIQNNEETGVLDLFKEKYPWINVEYNTKGGYTNLRDAINLSIAAKRYPNVAVGYPDHFADYISKNIQYALDEFIEDEELGIDLSDFNADFLKENQTYLYKDDGTPYTHGIPFNKSTEVMVYNKTFFDYFGLTVPATWDEVASVGTQILDIMADNYGKQILDDNNKLIFDFTDVKSAADFRPFSYDSLSNMFITGVRQWGGQYTKMGETIEKGQILFNSQETIDFLDFCNELFDGNKIGIPTTFGESQYCSNPFKAVKSVMTISSSAGVANNVPAGDRFSVGIAPIPYKDADHKYVISQGTNLAMFKGTKDQNTASWLLIKYLTAEEGNRDFAINTGYLPVTASGVASEEYQNFLNAEYGTSADLAKIAVSRLAEEVYGATKVVDGKTVNEWTRFIDPAFRGSSKVRDEVEFIIPLIFYGDEGKRMTPQEAVDYVYSKLKAYQ